MQRSGLQLQVLALYRRALRAARAKDVETAGAEAGAASSQTFAFVRERFRDDVRPFFWFRWSFGGLWRFVEVSTLTLGRRWALFPRWQAQSVGRKDFAVIEHLLRKGERDLKMLRQMKAASFLRVDHH